MFFQKIKNMILRVIRGSNVKKLDESANKDFSDLTDKIEHDFNNSNNKKEFDSPNINNAATYDKYKKIEDVLKMVGCKNEIFLKMQDFDKIDVENLRENFKILSSYKFSKKEISNILTQNVVLLYISNEILKKNCYELNSYFKDISFTKKIIYKNPKLLQHPIYVKEILEVFYEEKLSDELIRYVIEENIEVLFLKQDTIRQSFSKIKEYLGNGQSVETFIMMKPRMLTVRDKSIIEKKIKGYIV